MSEFKKPEPIFVDGLFIKDRNERTPDFILASYSIKIENFKKWLEANSNHAVNGWLNIDIKKSQKGSKYAELNTFKKSESELPASTQEPWPADQDKPF